MLISLALLGLAAITAVATILALIDCWVRGCFVYRQLRQERALLDAGFVPMPQSGEQRLRAPVRFDALATAARAPAPLASPVPATPRIPSPRIPSQRLKADRVRSNPHARRLHPGRDVA